VCPGAFPCPRSSMAELRRPRVWGGVFLPRISATSVRMGLGGLVSPERIARTSVVVLFSSRSYGPCQPLEAWVTIASSYSADASKFTGPTVSGRWADVRLFPLPA
jgi:hypothetical protein